MINWFECGVSYDKLMENGTTKRVTEPYLVDAMSFTEAEARIIEELKPFITGEFLIKTIKRANISELFFFSEGDRYFNAKTKFITLDEKSGSEKKNSVNMVVQASDIDQADEVLKKGMAGTLASWICASMTETQIMDVFPYSEDGKKVITL